MLRCISAYATYPITEIWDLDFISVCKAPRDNFRHCMNKVELKNNQVRNWRSCTSHHLLEGVLYSSYHQALVLDLLLVEEAWRRWRAARGTRCPRGPTHWGGPCQGPMRAWGVSLEVGVAAIRLLPQHGRGRWGRFAQDVDDSLQLTGDVVLQQAGGDDRRTRPSVTVEQGPVVEHKPFSVLHTSRKTYGEFKVGKTHICP